MASLPSENFDRDADLITSPSHLHDEHLYVTANRSGNNRFARSGADWRQPAYALGELSPQLSMYQFARSQVLLSQPLSSATSLFFRAATSGRGTTGITT